MRHTFALIVCLAAFACGGESSPPAASASKPTAPSQGSTPATAAAPKAPPAVTSEATGDTGAVPSETPAATSQDKDGPRVQFGGAGGRAHWAGEVPEVKTLSVQADAALQCEHAGEMDLRDPSVRVDAGGGLADVVIEVEIAGGKPQAPTEPFEVDQLGCTFLPHVSLVPVGATVRYKNSDPFTHNVNVVPRRATGMNVMVDQGGVREATYADSDQIQLKCDIHPWMSGWVFVSDAPVQVLSGADGSFALPALPAGSHKVSCWHATLGSASGTLVVGADGSIAELELALGKKKPR